MCLLFETIKVENKQFYNLDFHSARMNRSRFELFQNREKIILSEALKTPANLSHGLFKCRVIYSDKIESITFEPYQKRNIKSLKIIESDVNYQHKFVNRNSIESLLSYKEKYDDILIVKNGFVTDTSFSNICFWDGINWLTPSKPILWGIKRNFLIKTGLIHEKELRINDLKNFEKACLINAMLDLEPSNFINVSAIEL